MIVYGLVPAYNEEGNIRQVVRRLKKVGIKPVVIDDASRDGTLTAAKSTRSIVLSHRKNMGKAEAIKTGLRFLSKKKYDYVVLIDADLQYLPEEAWKLIEPLRKGRADFVAGYRDFDKVPFFRHSLGNFVWKTSFNILFGTRFHDTNCGFVAMTKKAAGVIQEKIHGGYILENSMFIQILRNRMRANQVPVTVKYHRVSGVGRGIKIVAGVSFYILHQGIRHRLGMK